VLEENLKLKIHCRKKGDAELNLIDNPAYIIENTTHTEDNTKNLSSVIFIDSYSIFY
jgi:hypothetical protein